MKNKVIVAVSLVLAVLSLWLSTTNGFNYLRFASGLFFVYLLSGFPLSLIVLPKTGSLLERVLLSGGISLFLTYPAGLLNVFFEGQSGRAIFGYHLTGDLVFLVLLTLISVLIVRLKNGRLLEEKLDLHLRPFWLLIIPVILSVFFNFYKLNKADLIGEEYDLGYQAYNLVDGIFAGRKAYALSFSAHPPLTMYIEHFTMQVLEPRGLDRLSDWMFRIAPAILGTLTVGAVFLIAQSITRSSWASFLAAMLLALNTYHVFLSRVFLREGFLTFFLSLFLLWLVRYQKDHKETNLYLAALSVGAAMLVKTTAVIAIATALLALILTKSKRLWRHAVAFVLVAFLIFLPVVVYNLGAYLTTGYTDIFFSRIFQTKTHPGASMIEGNISQNLSNLVNTLSDQYGPLLLTVLSLSLLLSLRFKKDTIIIVLFTLLSLVAFLLNGIRYYYLSFLSVPAVVLLVSLLLEMEKKWQFVGASIGLVLVFYSGFYSASTFFNVPPVFGFSTTAKTASANNGWKEIAGRLSGVYRPGNCLVAGETVTNLQLRRYLGTDDQVKEFYLGQNYPHRFKMCDEVEKPTKKIQIFYNRAGFVDYKFL